MREKCILASVMHFKDRDQGSGVRPACRTGMGQEKTNLVSCILCLVSIVFLLITCHLSLVTVVNAEVLDRVVAIVDDEIILLSEVEEVYQKALDSGIDIKKGEVLDSLINRMLLLKQAKRFTIEHDSAIQSTDNDNALIKEYIERNLKSFIRIPFEEIELFYKSNKEAFKGKDFYDVREEIEAYLIEEALNKRLILHIEELRKEVYIKIQTDN